jgi:signal transduction histidine kinase
VRAFADRRRDELIAAVGIVALTVNALGTEAASDEPVAAVVLVSALFAGSLAWRRRAPLAATALMIGTAVLESFWVVPVMDTYVAIPLLILMMYSLGFHEDQPAAAIGLAIGVAAAVGLSAVFEPGDIFFPAAFFFVMPWAAGRAVRHHLLLTRELAEQAARLEAEREERAARAVADERARIARELHDVVAHSLTVMVIQAGAARRLVDRDPERVAEVAATIKGMGREALDEMRRLVGVLHEQPGQPELAPQPTMGDLESLVERARAAGLEVDLELRGERADLPPGIDLSAYRVVQEALTNTVKHANARHARVVVSYGEEELELLVADDGAGGEGPELPSGGHGLVGMRERVALYGGELDAGPREGGGFEVRVRFPLRQEAYA